MVKSSSKSDSQIIELKGIPKHWKIYELDFLSVRVTDGCHASIETTKDGTIPFLYVSCVRDGKILWGRTAKITDELYRKISKGRKPEKGVILYTVVGSYGHAVLVLQDSHFAFQRHIAYIKPNKEKIEPPFLVHWLNSSLLRGYADRVAVGNAQKTVTLKELARFPVPVPSINEQRKIAEVLSSVDEAIAHSQSVIDQIRVVKRGLIRQLLTKGLPGWHSKYGSELGGIPIDWDIKKIGDVSTLVTSGSRGWAQYYSSCGVAFIRITNFVRGSIYLDLRDLRKVAIPQKVEGQRAQIFANDLLFSITAEVGLVSLVPADLGEAYINQHIALVRLDNHDFCPRFVAYWLLSQAGQEQFRRLNDAGAKAGLSLPSVRAIQLPKPSLDEQQKIAHILASVDQRLQAEHDKKSQLEATKKGLMQQLLTGKRRVPVDAVEPSGGG